MTDKIDEMIDAKMTEVKKRTAYEIACESAIPDAAAAKYHADNTYKPDKIEMDSDGNCWHVKKDGTRETLGAWVERKVEKLPFLKQADRINNLTEADQHKALLANCNTPAGQAALVKALNGDNVKANALLATVGLKLGTMKPTARLVVPSADESETPGANNSSSNPYHWSPSSRRTAEIQRLLSKSAQHATRLARAANCRIDGTSMSTEGK
jgi:hypothetical protein